MDAVTQSPYAETESGTEVTGAVTLLKAVSEGHILEDKSYDWDSWKDEALQEIGDAGITVTEDGRLLQFLVLPYLSRPSMGVRIVAHARSMKALFPFGYVDSEGNAWSIFSSDVVSGEWGCDASGLKTMDFMVDEPATVGSGYTDAASSSVVTLWPGSEDSSLTLDEIGGSVGACLLKGDGTVQWLHIKEGVLVREELGTHPEAVKLVGLHGVDEAGSSVVCLYRDSGGMVHALKKDNQ